MTVNAPTLSIDAAYARCRAYTRERATNFYYAFRSLPPARRRAIYAVYAFAGWVDDVVDDGDAAAARERGLAAARALLDRVYGGGSAEDGADAWLPLALGDAVRRFAIPRASFDGLVAGMAQDLTQTRYATFDYLDAYCYRAASVIGLICVEIFGYDRSRRALALEAAIDMGKALQLTNILRDVAEDLRRDRIYLAQADLARHGVPEAALRAGVVTPAVRALLAEYAGRAAACYTSGERLIPLLDGPRSRMCCNALQGVYRSILDGIIKRDYDVFSTRVSPSRAGRLLLLARLWMGGALAHRR